MHIKCTNRTNSDGLFGNKLSKLLLKYTPYRVICQPHTEYLCKIVLVINMKTRLRNLREDNDLTQEQCANIAFISKNSYIRYEKGERIPPLDTIKLFAEYYNVSIDYIAMLTDESNSYPKK